MSYNQPFETPPPVAPAPQRSNRGLVIGLIAAGVIGLILIVGGVGVFAFNLLQRPSSIPQLLGSDTQFYATLTPNLTDLPNVQRLQKAFPELFKEDGSTDAQAELERELGIDFEQDVAPWIGAEMAVAVSGLEKIKFENLPFDDNDEMSRILGEELEQNANIAFILSSRDDAAAKAFLDKFRNARVEKGDQFAESTHNGVTIYEQQEAEKSPATAFALVKKHVIFASNSAFIKAMIDRDGNGPDTLEKNARFQGVRSSLPEGAAGYVFIDAQMMSSAIKEAATQQLSMMPYGQATEVEKQLQNLDALNGIGLSVSFVATGVQFDASMSFDTSKLNSEAQAQLEAARQPVDAAMLQRIPANSFALMTFKIPTTFKDQIMTQIRALPDGEQSLESFEQQLGFDLESDLLEWFHGDAAIVILPGEKFGDFTSPATGYFTLRPADKTAAEAGMEKIMGVLETYIISSGTEGFQDDTIGGASWRTIHNPTDDAPVAGYGFIQDDMVIAFGNSAMEGAATGSQQPVAGHADFKATYDQLAQPNGGVFYVNIPGAVQAYRDAGMASDFEGSEAEKNLKPLHAVAAAGTPGIDTQGNTKARLVFYIPE